MILLVMHTCACEHAYVGDSDHPTIDTPLTQAAAQEIARLMGALATASRVRILARLRTGSCTVGDLSAEVEMEQPAVSHQLRILRDLGFVVGDRRGRHVVYGLFDSHVAALLDEAVRHIDHLSGNAQQHRSNRSGTSSPESVPSGEVAIR